MNEIGHSRLEDRYLDFLNKSIDEKDIAENTLLKYVKKALGTIYKGLYVGHYTKNGMTYIYSKQNDVETDFIVIDKKTNELSYPKGGDTYCYNRGPLEHNVIQTDVISRVLELIGIPVRRIRDFINLTNSFISKEYIVTILNNSEHLVSPFHTWLQFSDGFILDMVPYLLPDGTDGELNKDLWFGINRKLMFAIEKRRRKKPLVLKQTIEEIVAKTTTLMDKHTDLSKKEIIELYDYLDYFKQKLV